MTAAARLIREPSLVRLSRALLTRTVRGKAIEGTEWGEALLSELEEAGTSREAVRWTISSLPVAWRERRRRRSSERPPRPLRVRVARRVVFALALLLIGGFALNRFVATIYDEPSESMSPTYAVGTRVLIDKIGYHLNGLHNGDVVAVSEPIGYSTGAGDAVSDTVSYSADGKGDDTRFVSLKRVVGLPGDVIACNADGAVTRNGSVIAAPPSGNVGPPCSAVTVRSGFVFLLGDNFVNSYDSRMFGAVSQSMIIGRVVSKVWP